MARLLDAAIAAQDWQLAAYALVLGALETLDHDQAIQVHIKRGFQAKDLAGAQAHLADQAMKRAP